MSQNQRTPAALTIAGSDSSGGAGIQADLKTFTSLGAYGATVITLITAQNTRGVSALELIPLRMIRAQLEAVFDDLNIRSLKTGALGSSEVIALVADFLASHPEVPKVIDPVMVSKHGDPLLVEEAQAAFKERLLPLATLVTPNRHEVRALTGIEVEDLATAEEAGQAIVGLGAGGVLIKSIPHHQESVDLLVMDGVVEEIRSPLAPSHFTHGSGCTLSAAITAYLTRGFDLINSVKLAKQYTYRAMAQGVVVGAGINPLNHLATITPAG